MLTSALASQYVTSKLGEVSSVNVRFAPKIDQMIRGMDIASLPSLNVIEGMAAQVERQNRILSRLRPLPDIAMSASLATRALADIVRTTDSVRSMGLLSRIETAERATGWALQTGIALTEDDPDEDAEPGELLGPIAAIADLNAHLAALDPALADKRAGVWARIEGGGPDAPSQAANSLQELIDQTLRRLAPSKAVLEWHAAEGMSVTDLNDDKPTRPLRLLYIVRNHPEKRSSTPLYVRSLTALVKAVQSKKHGAAADVRAMCPLAMMADSLLMFILQD